MAKENDNIYYLTRRELGLTREKASELFDTISVDRLERIENEKAGTPFRSRGNSTRGRNAGTAFK